MHLCKLRVSIIYPGFSIGEQICPRCMKEPVVPTSPTPQLLQFKRKPVFSVSIRIDYFEAPSISFKKVTFADFRPWIVRFRATPSYYLLH